jgi:hypothetical protein
MHFNYCRIKYALYRNNYDEIPCFVRYVLPLRTEWGDAGLIMSVTVHGYTFVRCFVVEKCKQGKQTYKNK